MPKSDDTAASTSGVATGLASALRMSRDGFILLRLPTELILDVNDAWLSATGFTREEVIGRTAADLNLWASLEDQARFVRVIADHECVHQFEFRYRHKSGELRYALCSAEAVQIEGCTCAFIIGREVTDDAFLGSALFEGEDRFSKAFRSSSVGLVISRDDGRIVEVNANLEAILGLSRREIIGRTAVELGLIPVEAQEKDLMVLGERGAFRDREYAIIHRATGDQRYILVSAACTQLQGEPHYIGTVLDVTHRHRAEAALRRSESRYRNIFNLTEVSIWEEDFTAVVAALDQLKGRSITDLARYVDEHPEFVREAVSLVRIVDVNDTTLRMFGAASAEELVGALDDIFVPETYSVFRAELLALASGQSHFADEARLRRLDGTPIDVVFTMALPPRTGHADSVLVTLLDVTDRKRAEQALREMQRHLEAVLDYSPSVIFIKDWEGRHILINRRFASLFELRIEDVIGKTDYDIFPREVADTLRQNDLHVLQSGRPYEIEEIVPHADGLHTYIASKFPLHDANGHCYAVCGIATDITDRKRAEDQLRASREELRQLADRVLVAREEEATRIARELHDELGQALTSILIDLSFLEESCFDDHVADDRRVLMPRIRSAIKLAHATIDNVRRIATELRPALLDDFGLVAATEWQSQQFEQRTGIRCEVRAGLCRPQLPTRPSTALFRILQEALINVARHAGASKVSVSLEESDGCLRLTVEDDGRGITEMEQSSTRSLGLAGMRERARLLGGETRISGAPGVGTAIRVSVPLSEHSGDQGAQ